MDNSLIKRQAAIDAIGEKSDDIYKTKQKGATYPHDDFFQGMAYAENIVKQLPSAEPQIIRCKDCKHHWTHKCMDSMPIERCDLEQTFYDAERDFCSLAERKKVTT